MEDVFFRLSQFVTGEPELIRDLASGLLTRLRATPEAAHLERLLETYRHIEASGGDQVTLIRQSILTDPALKTLILMTILLWYTGELKTKEPTSATEEQYFSGVLWKIARAHPPGLSGGYFGHWTYPPDNA
jgi:hypothetical protein